LKGREPVMRGNAGSGDTIYVTGTLGDSLAGLEILTADKSEDKKRFKALLGKHQRPSCRIDLVDYILETFKPGAMIDISDGLLSDLNHICNDSKKGFTLYKEDIPISDNLKKYTGEFNKDPYKLAMESGEEYELIFTSKISPDSINPEDKADITPIGVITDEGYKLMYKGQVEEIPISGWDHFKS